MALNRKRIPDHSYIFDHKICCFDLAELDFQFGRKAIIFVGTIDSANNSVKSKLLIVGLGLNLVVKSSIWHMVNVRLMWRPIIIR